MEPSSPAQKAALHVEFTTDDLDSLYEDLKGKGVEGVIFFRERESTGNESVSPYTLDFKGGAVSSTLAGRAFRMDGRLRRSV